jgi:predicted RNase H-like HicB family nuclease
MKGKIPILFLPFLVLLMGEPGTATAGPVGVDIDPDTLNLESKGNWITAYISPSAECLPGMIDLAALAVTEVLRNGEDAIPVYIPAETSNGAVGDFDGDGAEELAAKFPRSSIQQAIGWPGHATLTVEGWCGTEAISGKDTIKTTKYYTTEIAAQLPEGIFPRDVTLNTPCLTNDLSHEGMLTLSGIPDNPFLIVGTLNSFPVVLSFFDPGGVSNGLSCFDTAVALVMLQNALYTLPPNLLPEALDLVRGVPSVGSLGDRLCQDLAMRPDALVSPTEELGEALQSASVAVNAALEALIADNGPQP